ncbi:MAG: hypothetical protein IPP33_13250 [Flavobacteriales bacterium]|nr:hypothetical protein [Flavobacteriales bacterium]
MTKTERFSSLADVRKHREQLRSRDARGRPAGALGELKDKEFRRGLMLDAASDLFRLNNGAGALGAIAGGVKMAGAWLPLIGPLLGGRKGILGSRLFWTGLRVALPLLVNKDGSSRIGELWEGLLNRFDQVKDLARSHNSAQANKE